MPNGKPVSRYCVVVLKDGRTVVDWGNSLFQDVLTGDFLPALEQDIDHMAQNEELEALLRTGCIDRYDASQAWMLALPEQPRRALD